MLLLAVALAGLPSLQQSEAQTANAMQQEQERFAALGRMAARTKAVQDRTKAELAQMRRGDFFGDPRPATSFAQRGPADPDDPRPAGAFADARANLAKVDSEAEAGLDSLDRKLRSQEARAQAPDAASLLESPRRKHSKQTPGFRLSPGLLAEKADLAKTKALAGKLHAARLGAEEQLHDALRRHEQQAAVEVAGEDPAAAAASLPPLDADDRAELQVQEEQEDAVDAVDDSLLQVGGRSLRVMNDPENEANAALTSTHAEQQAAWKVILAHRAVVAAQVELMRSEAAAKPANDAALAAEELLLRDLNQTVTDGLNGAHKEHILELIANNTKMAAGRLPTDSLHALKGLITIGGDGETLGELVARGGHHACAEDCPDSAASTSHCNLCDAAMTLHSALHTAKLACYDCSSALEDPDSSPDSDAADRAEAAA